MSSQTLELERPIVVFDLETTGLDVKTDRIVELSCVKIFPDETRRVMTLRINPGIPISEEATAVHGISNADVANEPRFADIVHQLVDFLGESDLAGFNVERFDLPLLKNEFERTEVAFPSHALKVIDSYQLFVRQEPRDLTAAYRFYCGKDLNNAHSAQADAEATAEILLAQVARYDELPKNVAALSEFCHPKKPEWIDRDGKVRWRKGEPVLSFGKHKDRSLQAIATSDRGYLQWIAKADFSQELVGIINEALEGRFPAPQQSA